MIPNNNTKNNAKSKMDKTNNIQKKNIMFPEFIFNTVSSLLGSILYQKIDNIIIINRLKNIFKEVVGQYRNKISIKDIDELELADIWEEISKHLDIKNAVATKLINDPQIHISHLAFYAQSIEDNFNGIKKILETDERNDISDPKDFFKLYPSSAYCIEDLFIEPIYHVLQLEDEQSTIFNINKSNIEETCNNILEDQRILLLMGPYGSGKTVLSKHLISHISDGLSIYIHANKLPKNLNDMFPNQAINILIERHKKLYIFLDACENYFIANPNEWEIIYRRISKFPNLRFVINMRKPSAVKLPSLFTDICYFFDEMKYIELAYFDKRLVSQWLALYSNQSLLLNRKTHVTINDINQNKYLQSTCYNPLMLAMMAEPENSYNLSKNNGWYYLFNDFVKKTIRGKFDKDKGKNQILVGIAKEYKNFVYELAIETLKQPQLKITYDKENQDFFVLDSNEENYSVEQTIIDQLLTDNLKKQIIEQNRIQFLNCFFFEYEEFSEKWRFRDNNILYFLCADKIFNQLNNLIKIYNMGDSKELVGKYNDFLKDFGNIQIHPVIIDFILDAIIESKKEKDYVELIKKIIDENLIINFPNDKSFYLDYNKIKIDILLSVILLRFNKSYSKDQRLSHYFKNISHYYSIIKIVDKDLSSILRRYYRNISVSDVEFRRINLKEFNWNDSTMEKTKFIQCKFKDTPMNNITFRETSFEQCFFLKNNIKYFSGNIDFNLCQIQESTFSTRKSFSLSFQNCNIKNLTLECDKTLNLFFNCCKINDLKINCKITCISISDCNINGRIDLSNTKAYFSRPGEVNIVNIKKMFRSDNAERLINTIPSKECNERCYIVKGSDICQRMHNLIYGEKR